MTDPRVLKLAKVLVNYSVDIKPGQQLHISSSPLAYELTLAIYEEAIKAGANVFLEQPLDEASELLYKFARMHNWIMSHRLESLSMRPSMLTWRLKLRQIVGSLSGIDPQRMARRNKANSGLMKTFLERASRGELHWCLTVFPNNANAQDADMSLRDYTEFVFSAGMLNEDDPVAFWKALGKQQTKLVAWLKGRKNVQF